MNVIELHIYTAFIENCVGVAIGKVIITAVIIGYRVEYTAMPIPILVTRKPNTIIKE